MLILNIIVTIKYTKLYTPDVILSSKENKKLLKLLNKKFEISVYWSEYKAKKENKNIINKYRCFIESNFLGVDGLFVLFYWNATDNAKKYGAKKYYLPKGLIKNFNAIVNRKSFYDQFIDSAIK